MTESLRRGVARASWRARPGRPSRIHSLLVETQWWDRSSLEALQLAALRGLLEAGSSAPLVRARLDEAAAHARDVDSFEALARLRPLDRADLQHHASKGLKPRGARGVTVRSSGSTGRPIEALASLEQRAWGDAAARRGAEWLGIDPDGRRVHVSAARALGTRRSRANAALANRTLVPVRQLEDPRATRALLGSLERRPPQSIEGLSTGIYLLSRLAEQSGAEIRPRVCWSGGNHLVPHYRGKVEEAFQCRVYERYSAWETGLIAHQCPHGSWHVVAETAIVEVAGPDGLPVAPGEMGEVLVTSLRNKAMPLVRYRIGDLARAPEPKPCPCGRSLPRLGELIGRSNDMLVAVDGRLIPPTVISRMMSDAGPSVIEFRVRQHSDRRASVELVQCDDPLADDARERVRRDLDALLGEPGIAHVRRVERVSTGPGGKLRHVTSDASPVEP